MAPKPEDRQWQAQVLNRELLSSALEVSLNCHGKVVLTADARDRAFVKVDP